MAWCNCASDSGGEKVDEWDDDEVELRLRWLAGWLGGDLTARSRRLMAARTEGGEVWMDSTESVDDLGSRVGNFWGEK